MPGIINLPTGWKLNDGEIIITQQVHRALARSGISTQLLPNLGVSFRYTGAGRGGSEAYGRTIHDRSFDAHFTIWNEKKFLPGVSVGLRDFIGTGLYSSEYFVGSKTFGNLELTAGIGYGRLAGRDTFKNPLSLISQKLEVRENNNFGLGGTLGTVNWFRGPAAGFYGLSYGVNGNLKLLAEYTSDLMVQETSYMDIKTPWNFGVIYDFNKYLDFSAHYLHGDQISFTAHLSAKPNQPPLLGGKELAPVPMRLRGKTALPVEQSNEPTIRKVLKADRFEIYYLKFEAGTVHIGVNNTKFRSQAQALGRVTSTLQRFTSDKIKTAKISFYSEYLRLASYTVDLEKVTEEQFNPFSIDKSKPSIIAADLDNIELKNTKKFDWGIGPYFAHRLFNPDLPLSMEMGIELEASYQIVNGLKFSGALRKSILTNLTDNTRRSNSALPRVHSDWALYDIAGQSGHIHKMTLSYVKNLAPGFYGRAHAGLLEPFFAGIGGEILYKPAQWPIGIGIDIHRVRKRDYDMRFDLLEYDTTVGHISFYYDAGGMFDIEVNAGRYLAGDWGATTTIARKFGSGWEVGGYATLTDVPFANFGEGSFDKAIYVSVPIDWIISSPNRTKRRLTLRPITRDGGAQLSSARQLYKQIEGSQNSNFQREFGRLWK